MNETPSLGPSPALSSLRLQGGGALARADDQRLEDTLRAARAGESGEAATAFQEVLATLLVKELRRSVPQGLFGQGAGADVYEGWFDEHLGRTLAERDALGLAKTIQASLARKADASAYADLAQAHAGADPGVARDAADPEPALVDPTAAPSARESRIALEEARP
jgi:Rod binding domain-containing protein